MSQWQPVHILQGMQDESVPWSHAIALAEKLTSDSVSLTPVKTGRHRLAREEDLSCSQRRSNDSIADSSVMKMTYDLMLGCGRSVSCAL
jgi:hypothetical protein